MLKEDIARLVQTSAEELGFMIYDYSLYIRGEGSKIGVKIDSMQGIRHSDCEMYSERLSQKLDEAQLLPNYSLEVSSPGLNRKIRTVEEYARFMNAPVKVIYDEGEKRSTIKGKIKAVNGDVIIITDGKKDMEISFSNIAHANLDY